ncbi:DedA family protein [Clostridium tyrobutyricum]|jgi:membrane protein DedA with SNARE-associated domain|uniref:DedA family protein n=1 Tax=Clostridium tyrobutyricum TaxID=1519 RepID=UPI00037A8A66|nr:DedA family protein [Clostridium tyrobutyricum]MBV4416151.1 DedA family protein [Clostridium tyrobutyricum]MBV4418500.1 DedA family protein [Clostridium tyrobutyricum]MBV4421894.1 DedA family protein [Clostridium tyrobutyricum]MBV4424262.1 DedA family protein [Clostridium tyrobutyricum]MBV4428844.1 DedA family protein [Clostridium tyrobutyricum]
MEQIILNVIEQFGYIGICLLIAVENIFPPIPSEVILTFGGFMTTFSSMNIWLVILVATIGSVIGALVLYAIGRFLSTERLEKLVQGKFGKVMHLKSEDIQKAEKWFGEHGNKAVFFCRFVPIVRSLISIPAGITKMKLSSFLILTISGTFIWNVVLVYLGRFAGNAWETIASYVDIYSIIAAVFFILIALILGAVFIKKRFIANNSEEIN